MPQPCPPPPAPRTEPQPWLPLFKALASSVQNCGPDPQYRALPPHTPGKGLFTPLPPHVQTCSNWFRLNLTVQGTPPPPPDIFKLVQVGSCCKIALLHVQSFSVRGTYIQQMNDWHPAGMLCCLYLCLCVCLSVEQCERTIIIPWQTPLR